MGVSSPHHVPHSSVVSTSNRRRVSLRVEFLIVNGKPSYGVFVEIARSLAALGGGYATLGSDASGGAEPSPKVTVPVTCVLFTASMSMVILSEPELNAKFSK